MNYFEQEKLSKKQIMDLGSDLSEGNDYITETAGFIPLDVKLRRFQETGQIMQFHTSEFTSADYRDMYLSPDLEITPEMDLEEITEIQMKRREFVNKLMKSKVGNSEGIANSPSDSAAAKTEEKTETEE